MKIELVIELSEKTISQIGALANAAGEVFAQEQAKLLKKYATPVKKNLK